MNGSRQATAAQTARSGTERNPSGLEVAFDSDPFQLLVHDMCGVTQRPVTDPQAARAATATAAAATANAAGLKRQAVAKSPRARAMDARVRPQVGLTSPTSCVGIGRATGIPPATTSRTAAAAPNATMEVRRRISS